MRVCRCIEKSKLVVTADVDTESCYKICSLNHSSGKLIVDYSGFQFLEHARNFQKYPRDLGSSFGKPYDYESVMHYSKFAFSKDRNIPTIVPTDEKATIGQRLGLSYYDREEINKLYNCQGENKNDSFTTK